MQTPITVLDDETGTIRLYPEWLQNSEGFYRFCRDSLPWSSRTIRIFGKEHQIPRQECWLAEPGLEYGYSGQSYTGAGWPTEMQEILQTIEQDTGFAPNGALLNYYRSGRDAMGWHADNESELGTNPTIAILTLGGVRDFHFRRTENHNEKLKLRLGTGSLLMMCGPLQHHWQHALPKRAQAMPRISCTFRKILLGPQKADC